MAAGLASFSCSHLPACSNGRRGGSLTHIMVDQAEAASDQGAAAAAAAAAAVTGLATAESLSCFICAIMPD